MSKEQQKLLEVIKGFYPGTIISDYRPDVLKNPGTGNNLEIDIYLPERKLGFEYQGAIHFERVEKYKNNPDKSRHHDTIKSDITDAKRNSSLTIIEIFPHDLIGDIKANIIYRLLTMQQIYFEKKQFLKCRNIEFIYLIAAGSKVRHSAMYFMLCNRIMESKMSYKNIDQHTRTHSVKCLLQFYKTVEFYNPNRKCFDLESLSINLFFDKIYKEFMRRPAIKPKVA